MLVFLRTSTCFAPLEIAAQHLFAGNRQIARRQIRRSRAANRIVPFWQAAEKRPTS
jgi:hypothetical protein